MQLSLLPLDPPPCLRYFIRADGRHAGGITVHSVQGAQFSYGVAVSGDMRRTTPLRWRCTENWALFKPGGMHRP